MYYNVWIILTLSLVLITTCYCGKREFFDEVTRRDENGDEIRFNEYGKQLSTINLGIKYTIEDVNKVTQAIIQYFGEKYDVNISITKIISIKHTPGVIKLQLFLYNPIKNTIIGYEIDVTLPISKKEKSIVKFITPFSKEEPLTESIQFNPYSTINFNDGTIT